MKRRALLVGVNVYEKLGRESNLNGCVNDVLNMRDILKTFYGFTNSDIVVLTDERATESAISFALEDLVHKAEPGDKILFHFSGHGSQIRDTNGDELEDGLDELICPYDMDWAGAYIMDDDLANTLDRLADGVCMEVILDCCHSGTGIRELKSLTPQHLCDPRDLFGNRPRFLPPPIDFVCRAEGEKELPTYRLLAANQYLSKPVLWAGCKSTQTSADAFIDHAYNGAFTYNLCKAIRAANGNVSRAQLLQSVRAYLGDSHFEQEPQLETREAGKITSNFLE